VVFRRPVIITIDFELAGHRYSHTIGSARRHACRGRSCIGDRHRRIDAVGRWHRHVAERSGTNGWTRVRDHARGCSAIRPTHPERLVEQRTPTSTRAVHTARR
jgi:hypothetical protein